MLMFSFNNRNQLVPGGSSRVWSLFGFVPLGCPFCSNGTLLPRLRVKFRARQRRCYSNSGNIIIIKIWKTNFVILTCIILYYVSNCMARVKWTRHRLRSGHQQWAGVLLQPHHDRMEEIANFALPMSKSTLFLLDLTAKLTSLKVIF
jgi:hypothetical protein